MGLDLTRLQALAAEGGVALGCEIEEHVMFSRLRAFRGGAAAWSVTHDPDVDVRGVAVEGDPPPPFADLRATLAAEQATDDSGEVDYMFDLPPRLGEQLCGYAHDRLMPVVWSILEPPRRGRSAEAPPRLPKAFVAEILPLLTAAGWTLAAQDPAFRGRAWDVIRVVDDRIQVLAFHFREKGPELQFETSFVVLDGPTPAGKLLRAGQTRPGRPPPAAGSGESFWRRIADRFRTGSAAEPEGTAAADPLAELMSRVKEDLAAIEAFLNTGERNPRLQINRDSS
jgi:hypothetical protein